MQGEEEEDAVRTIHEMMYIDREKLDHPWYSFEMIWDVFEIIITTEKRWTT